MRHARVSRTIHCNSYSPPGFFRVGVCLALGLDTAKQRLLPCHHLRILLHKCHEMLVVLPSPLQPLAAQLQDAVLEDVPQYEPSLRRCRCRLLSSFHSSTLCVAQELLPPKMSSRMCSGMNWTPVSRRGSTSTMLLPVTMASSRLTLSWEPM